VSVTAYHCRCADLLSEFDVNLSPNLVHTINRRFRLALVQGTCSWNPELRQGRERAELRVVDDQRGGPTEARDIADAILVMAAACQRPGFDKWGAYHFAGAPSVSWYGFAEAIFAANRGPRPSLVKIATYEYPAAARRPQNSTLDCTRIRQTFGIDQPDWRRSLLRVIEELDRADR